MGSVKSMPVTANDTNMPSQYTVTYGTVAKSHVNSDAVALFQFPGIGDTKLPPDIDLRKPNMGCYPYPAIQQQSLLSNCSSVAVAAAFQCVQRRQVLLSHATIHEDRNNQGLRLGYEPYLPTSQHSQNEEDKKDWIVPSALYNYYYARRLSNRSEYENGTTVEAALQAMMMGIADESTWPYDAAKVNTTPSVESQRNAQNHSLVQYERLNPSLQNLKLALFNKYPVLFSFVVTKSMDAWFRNRDAQLSSGHMIVVDAFAKADIIGAHTVLIVGYDDDYLKLGAFLCRNSWGVEFGLDGHFWFPYGDVAYPDLSLSFMLVKQVCVSSENDPKPCVSSYDCQNLYSADVCNISHHNVLDP